MVNISALALQFDEGKVTVSMERDAFRGLLTGFLSRAEEGSPVHQLVQEMLKREAADQAPPAKPVPELYTAGVQVDRTYYMPQLDGTVTSVLVTRELLDNEEEATRLAMVFDAGGLFDNRADAEHVADMRIWSSINAHLRALGGGNTGKWVARYSADAGDRGMVSLEEVETFSPDEARFETKAELKEALRAFYQASMKPWMKCRCPGCYRAR